MSLCICGGGGGVDRITAPGKATQFRGESLSRRDNKHWEELENKMELNQGAVFCAHIPHSRHTFGLLVVGGG